MYRFFFPDFIAFPSCNLDIAMENQWKLAIDDFRGKTNWADQQETGI